MELSFNAPNIIPFFPLSKLYDILIVVWLIRIFNLLTQQIYTIIN